MSVIICQNVKMATNTIPANMRANNHTLDTYITIFIIFKVDWELNLTVSVLEFCANTIFRPRYVIWLLIIFSEIKYGR